MVKRVDVAVDVHVDTEGNLTPTVITWINDDESITKYEVTYLRKEKRASRKAGGCGWCYTVLINGNEKELFYDTITENWFVEAKTY